MLAAAICGCAAATAKPASPAGASVVLPGLQYSVLRSGPAGGARPTRADAIDMRYVGRLQGGQIFSTSADNGKGTSRFDVQKVIPGFMAAVQLMRPGDRWRITLPAYLAYGARGRRYTPPEATLKRDIPPSSTLIFDVELVAITPAAQ